MKYEVTFIDEESNDEVFFLGIEAKSRTEMLYNILTEEWHQSGHFSVNEDDLRDIFFNLLSSLSGGEDWADPEDADHGYYLFKLKEFCRLNLNIREFLDKYWKEISDQDILDHFCSAINDLFHYESGSINHFDYEIKSV
jgi:hypothetical protein